MKIPTHVLEIQDRIFKRQAAKKEIDKGIRLAETDSELAIGQKIKIDLSLANIKHSQTLAMQDDMTMPQTMRLLDEGVVVDADGWPLMIIAKGSLGRFYEKLKPSYVGGYNMGHIGFVTFPINLGEWTKSDLTLVDNDDERQGIDVNVKLYSNISLVKDMQSQKLPRAISAEFNAQIVAFELVDEYYEVPVYDNIVIDTIGIVGAPGNAESYGLMLEEQSMSEQDKKKLAEAEEAKQAAEADAATEADAKATDAEAKDDAPVVDETATDKTEDEATDDADKADDVAAEVEKASAELAELRDAKTANEARIKELESELKAAKDANEEARKLAETNGEALKELQNAVRRNFGESKPVEKEIDAKEKLSEKDANGYNFSVIKF